MDEYTTSLESAFRVCKGNNNQLERIIDNVKDVLPNVLELNKNCEYVAAHPRLLDIMLPKAEDVQAPGTSSSDYVNE